MTPNQNFEVIIIGGSYAGLSAAMALGRALRKTLVIDSGLPCNRYTPYAHNFITQDGETPSKITEKAKHQVLKYPTVTFLAGLAVSGKKIANGFSITLQNGQTFHAQSLIFATGVKDLMPKLKGFAACWGKSVVHCPYCHGYEVKGKKTGIIANGNMGFHYAQLIQHWTKDLTLFTNGKSTLTAEQTVKLTAHNIVIVEKIVVELKHQQGQIQQILFTDNSTFDLQAIYAKPDFEQHCTIPKMLGCALTEEGYIQVDALQQTNLENVYACGDCTTPLRSVANAVAAGNVAGAILNNKIIETAF